MIFVFFIFLVVNLTNSIEISRSLGRTFGFLRFILLSSAIFYFLSYKNFKYLKFISTSWMIIFLIVTIDLLYEFIFGYNIVGFSNQFPGRLSSFLNDELKIGGYYYGFIIITAATIFHFYKKRFGIIFIIFSLIIAVLIGERANLIKIIFSTIIFFSFINLFNIKQKILIISSSLIIFICVILSNQDLKNRFSNQFLKYIYQNGLSNYYVISQYGAHYDSAIQIIKKNIMFGVGLKNFPIECAKDEYINTKFTMHGARCSTHPHQIHLDLLTSLGLSGYLILMFSLFYLLYKNIKNFKKNNNLFTLSGISFLISTLITPVPSGAFFTSYAATIFWINIGIILAFEKFKIKN